MTTAIWRIKLYLQSWTTLYLLNLPINMPYWRFDGGMHVLNEYKAIIEFGFRIIWRIMEILEGVMHLSLLPHQITPSLISIILQMILSVIQ